MFPGPVPAFSALIPVYQSAAFIGDALRSVLRQSSPPVQIVVVDDGSTDDLHTALVPYLDLIEVVRISHAGLPAARNAGLGKCRGQFVAFLDADDEWEPDFLEALGALAAARPDLDLLTSDATFITDGSPGGTFYEANDFPVEDQRREILDRCYLTTKTAVRRDAVMAIGGFDERLLYAEDWDCWLRLILAGARVGLVDSPLSRYRLHPGQLSSRRAASLRERSQVLEKALSLPYLTEEERGEGSARLAHLRRRAALASALDPEEGEARGAWLDLARLDGASSKLRVAGLLGALLPGMATRLLRKRYPRP